MAAQENPSEPGFHLDFSLGRAPNSYQNEARNRQDIIHRSDRQFNSFNTTSSPVLPLQQQQANPMFNAKHLSSNATAASHNPMSLRTRESSALALKHIFDQQLSNSNNGSPAANSSKTGAAAAPDQESSQQQEFTGRALQGLRNQSMPDLRSKRLPELDLSFRQQHFSSLFQAPSSQSVLETGFGSPISTPQYSSSQQQQHPEEEQPQQATTAAHRHQWPPLMHQRPAVMTSSPSTPANQSNKAVSTAQLTIFYSGTVNVYDDVPADKAHAIMLLAGNSWSSNSGSRSTVEKIERGCVNPAAASNNLSSVNLTLPPPAPSASPSQSMSPSPPPPAPSLSTLRSSSPCPSPSPVAAATTTALVVPSTPYNKASAPSPVAPPSIPSSPIPQTPVKRQHTGIELPHARKASLARFLEKRKDRVQVVAAKPVNNNEEKLGDAKEQPDQEPPSKKPCVDQKPCSERSGFPPCPAAGAAMNYQSNNDSNRNNDNDTNTEMMLQQQHHHHLHHPLFDRKIEHRFMD